MGALAKQTLSAERNYLKLQKLHKNCKNEKLKFLDFQSKFDKLVKKAKCKLQRNKVYELKQANLNDPKAF